MILNSAKKQQKSLKKLDVANKKKVAKEKRENMLNVVTLITFCARISHFLDKFSRIMALSRLNPAFQGGSNGIQHAISGEM